MIDSIIRAGRFTFHYTHNRSSIEINVVDKRRQTLRSFFRYCPAQFRVIDYVSPQYKSQYYVLYIVVKILVVFLDRFYSFLGVLMTIMAPCYFGSVDILARP